MKPSSNSERLTEGLTDKELIALANKSGLVNKSGWGKATIEALRTLKPKDNKEQQK